MAEVECNGVVGEYYLNATGDGLAQYWPDEEGDRAWRQVTPTTRVQLRAKRISHSSCVWEHIQN